MIPQQTIFLTGATGYLGGSILWRLLNHVDAPHFVIRALVRNPEKARRLQSEFSVQPVVGSLQELHVLEREAAGADITITAADINYLPATHAILRGMRARREALGTVPILIQTSGTATVDDNAAGMYGSSKIYEDTNVEEIEALADTQPHRIVDSTIAKADQQGYVRAYIIFPSTVYGLAVNGLTKRNLQNPLSVQLPALIRAGLDRRQGGMIGLGQNYWPNVHIEDQADLYMLLFDKSRNDPENTPHGRHGLYFSESGEHRLYDVCKAISEVLYEKGHSKTPEPTTFTPGESLKYFGNGPDYYGTNSRCSAKRARALGWSPKRTTAHLLASVRPEVEAILRETS